MSNNGGITSLRAAVYQIACPKCGAEGGKYCVRVRKNVRHIVLPTVLHPHAERYKALQPELSLDSAGEP